MKTGRQRRFPGPREPHEDGGAALRRDRARVQGQHPALLKQGGEDGAEQEQAYAVVRGAGVAIDDDLCASTRQVASHAVHLQPQLSRSDLKPDPLAHRVRQLRRNAAEHDLHVGLARSFQQFG